MFALMRVLSRLILKLMGWKTAGEVPPVKKYVMIGYPHTSNWDTFIGLLIFTSMGVRLKWLGKHTLFKGPLGWLMRMVGGVPVVREKSQNFVQSAQQIFKENEEFVLTLSPEGTRKKTEYWRTGFYYIALGAGIPIAVAFLDYPRKTGGFGPLVWPSGNIVEDIEKIRNFYESNDIHGKFPENEGPVRIPPEKAKKAKSTGNKS